MNDDEDEQSKDDRASKRPADISDLIKPGRRVQTAFKQQDGDENGFWWAGTVGTRPRKGTQVMIMHVSPPTAC